MTTEAPDTNPIPEEPPTEHVAMAEVLLTRAQTARRIGVSIGTVRRMEGAELHPIVINGKHCFHPAEVERYRRLTDGQIAARAFQMFNEGRGVIDVVIELEQPPEPIERLYSTWDRLASTEAVSTGGHLAQEPTLWSGNGA